MHTLYETTLKGWKIFHTIANTGKSRMTISRANGSSHQGGNLVVVVGEVHLSYLINSKNVNINIEYILIMCQVKYGK